MYVRSRYLVYYLYDNRMVLHMWLIGQMSPEARFLKPWARTNLELSTNSTSYVCAQLELRRPASQPALMTAMFELPSWFQVFRVVARWYCGEGEINLIYQSICRFLFEYFKQESSF